MVKIFGYTVDDQQENVLVDLKYVFDEEGDDLVTEVTVITPVKAEHQPYVKEDVIASIHGLGIRLYDDYKFNF